MAKSGKGAQTLKKITTRAKALKKKKPGIMWKTAVKQAGAEFRSGKLGKVRKKRRSKAAHAVKRRKVGARSHAVKPKTKAVARKRATRKRSSRRIASNTGGAPPVYMSHYTIGRKSAPRKRRRVGRKKSYRPVKNVTHCRRVGASGSNMAKYALLAGLGVVALYAFTRPSTTTTLTPAATAAGGSSILAYATAAGASATAIANLISKLNTSTPAQVQTAQIQLATTNQLPSDWQSVIAAGASPSTSNTALATQVLSSDE